MKLDRDKIKERKWHVMNLTCHVLMYLPASFLIAKDIDIIRPNSMGARFPDSLFF